MKKNREELTRIHKEKCRELKEIRARIAADLGVELNQRECAYEGYCSGTCPACRSEEIKLNGAILKKQAEGISLKGRMTAAGLAAAATLCLSGCTVSNQDTLEGDTRLPDNPPVTSTPENDMPGQNNSSENKSEQYELEGDYDFQENGGPREKDDTLPGYEIQGEIMPDMDGPCAEAENG